MSAESPLVGLVDGRIIVRPSRAWLARRPAVARLLDDHFELTDEGWAISLLAWRALGTPEGTQAELGDDWAVQHAAAVALVEAPRRLDVASVGHVGVPEIRFELAPSPRGALPSPVEQELRARFDEFNAHGKTSRDQQFTFLAELQQYVQRVTSLSEGSTAPISVVLDEHLRSFRFHDVDSARVGWVAASARGATLDLTVSADVDGSSQVFDLGRLSADGRVLSKSAKEHLFLSESVATVARTAKAQRNRRKRDVEGFLSDPSRLLPEGFSGEGIDFSEYSPRVAGFEPIIRAERDADITSSGVSWYDANRDASFVSLFIAQPDGTVATIGLDSPEYAQQTLNRLEAALASSPEVPIEVGGCRVLPSVALCDRIRRELAAFGAEASTSEPLAASPPEPPKTSGRLAAVIRETQGTDATPLPVAEIDVPWSALDSLLRPGVGLKEHQREGLRWLWRHLKSATPGVLLADDMGLGKTLQLASLFLLARATRSDALPPKPTLVVCPVILLQNWVSELEKFFRPEAVGELVVLYGETTRKLKRGDTIDANPLRRASVVITNYETLAGHQQQLLRVDWSIVVLDEAQAIKNPETYRTRAARGLKRELAICSTGTPVENSLMDLWTLYDVLSPGRPFAARDAFKREFASAPDGPSKARAALAPHDSILRRTKSEVLRALPSKTTHVVPVAMTDEQVRQERELSRPSRPIFKILSDLQRLYQHPWLLAPATDRIASPPVEQLIGASPKLGALVATLEQIRQRGEKALVFTIWREMQDLLRHVLRECLGLKDVNVLNGEANQGGRSRQYLKAFAASTGFDVLILSPIAAGTGLTIVEANHVIHYGRWWNPAKEDQATDRAYRIGQTKDVHVYYPVLHKPGDVTAGFDMRLHQLVEKKRTTQRDFLGPRRADDITEQDFREAAE